MNAPDPLLLGLAPRREEPPVPRKAWVAGVLGLLCDGLGHFYCGRVGQAVLWAIFPILAMVTAMTLGVFTPARLPLFIAQWTGIAIVSRVTQALLAARLAGRLAAYRPTRVNTVPMYVAFFLIVWAAGNLVARPFRASVLEPFKVPSSSMAPTLLLGDQVYVVKAGPHAAVRRGDVIVYRLGAQARIARLVAVGGDTVELNDNVLWVNGAALPTRPCDVPTFEVVEAHGTVTAPCWVEDAHRILADRSRPAVFAARTLAEGEHFVMGDWRDNADDSRFNGPVAADAIVGRVAVIWLSIDDGWSIRWQRIGLQP